jgi:hypothetical protein
LLASHNGRRWNWRDDVEPGTRTLVDWLAYDV